MDGSKSTADTPPHLIRVIEYMGDRVGRKQGGDLLVDRPDLKIPVVVAAKIGENPIRRKGKGFLTMFVNQELAEH